MKTEKIAGILTENHILFSSYLDREVTLDIYLPTNVLNQSDISLLLINDGQDLFEIDQGRQSVGILKIF